jgi:hypothetical protein
MLYEDFGGRSINGIMRILASFSARRGRWHYELRAGCFGCDWSFLYCGSARAPSCGGRQMILPC